MYILTQPSAEDGSPPQRSPTLSASPLPPLLGVSIASAAAPRRPPPTTSVSHPPVPALCCRASAAFDDVITTRCCHHVHDSTMAATRPLKAVAAPNCDVIDDKARFCAGDESTPTRRRQYKESLEIELLDLPHTTINLLSINRISARHH